MGQLVTLSAKGGGTLRLSTGQEFPTSVSFSKSANWETVSTIARWAPVYGYSSSASLRITLNVRLSIEYGSTVAAAKFLLSLVYPDYSGTAYRPPGVTLSIEDFPPIEGHVDSVTVSVPDDSSWVGSEPAVIDCQVGVVEDSLTFPIWVDAARSNTGRGV
jgi:hypothetical protein